ncbi:MAG TPA: PEP-CTERM sorting domain-containing protein [Verrucomicrobiae bacterium]|nr:PEP-CTERM sorting domain-containing protein [Verrucomicrobiae bacterium]
MKNTLAVYLMVMGLTASLANAQNLLSNGDFNDPNSTAAPADWNLWNYGGGWANHQNNTSGPLDGVDGTYYMADGGGSDAGGGEYQIVSGAPGWTYTLTVDSGAQAWWLPYGEMRMFFLDASSNQLAEAFTPTVDPADYGQNYDIPHAWSNYTLTAVAPANTALVKVELAEPNGTGTVWFDNAVLTAVPEPSTVGLVMGGLLFVGVWIRRGIRRS